METQMVHENGRVVRNHAAMEVGDAIEGNSS
jgi:hypothetical protein